MKSNLIRFLIVQALWLITQGAALADTKYEVWRSTSNNSATAQRIANNVSGTSYDDTSVSSGQTYYYWIKVRTDVTAWASKFIVYDFLYVTNYLICPTSARRGSRSEIITATDFSGPIGDLTVTWNLKEKDVLFHDPMATWSKTVFIYDNFTVLRVWKTNYVNLGDYESSATAEVYSQVVVPTSMGGSAYIDTPVVNCSLQANWDSAPSGVAASDGTYSDRVRITWRAASGNSDFSSADSGYASCPVPGTPTGVSASDGTYCGYVRVTWNSVSGATSYEVYRDGGLVGSPTGTSYDDNPGDTSTHSYTVKAKNRCGTSGSSSSNSGWANATPSAPTGVSASDGTYCGFIRVTWRSATRATSYEVYRDGVLVGSPTGTSYDDNPGDTSTHSYTVKAKNSCGKSSSSSSNSGWANAPPPAPTGVSASDGTYCGFIRVTWNSATRATSYEVYRDGVLVGSPTGTSIDDSVGDTSSHSYTVKAKNSCGTSGAGGPDSGYSSCPCSYVINPTSTNINDGAFSGAFSVTAGAGCSWSAVANQDWIHTSSSGSGNGTVNYTVDANADASSRSGTITVGGQTFTVNQAGVSCSYVINPTSTNIAAGAFSGAFSVTARAGCSWSAVANQDWIHTSSSGSGNGTVNYTIDANAGAMRSGTITVGGQNFTVNQDGTIVQTNLVRRVAGGSVNGTAINSSAHTVTVAPGQSLSGAIKVEAVNSLASASIAPLGATVNWGDRTKQLWVVDGWIDTGTNIYTVPVNKTAPSTPGEYYLVVAFAGTYNLAQVMSATHPAREAIWNDGNDVAFDWNAAQFAEALANGGGTTIAWREPSGSGFYNDWLPCTAVKIVVTQTTQTNLVRRVAGGSVNGTAINSSAHTVTVAPGQSLSGAIKVEAVNSLASASIAPLGGDGELGRPDKAALGGRRMD